MPGRGRPPKDKAERRNRVPPARGEWEEVTEPERVKVPKLPPRGAGRGHWSARTRAAWKAWHEDPVATMWGTADRDLVLHLADVYEEWVRRGTVGLASECRQLRDNLGLTPRGRQDRRWRLAGGAQVVPITGQAKEQQDGPEPEPGPQAPRPARRHLLAVDPGA